MGHDNDLYNARHVEEAEKEQIKLQLRPTEAPQPSPAAYKGKPLLEKKKSKKSADKLARAAEQAARADLEAALAFSRLENEAGRPWDRSGEDEEVAAELRQGLKPQQRRRSKSASPRQSGPKSPKRASNDDASFISRVTQREVERKTVKFMIVQEPPPQPLTTTFTRITITRPDSPDIAKELMQSSYRAGRSAPRMRIRQPNSPYQGDRTMNDDQYDQLQLQMRAPQPQPIRTPVPRSKSAGAAAMTSAVRAAQVGDHSHFVPRGAGEGLNSHVEAIRRQRQRLRSTTERGSFRSSVHFSAAGSGMGGSKNIQLATAQDSSSVRRLYSTQAGPSTQPVMTAADLMDARLSHASVGTWPIPYHDSGGAGTSGRVQSSRPYRAPHHHQQYQDTQAAGYHHLGYHHSKGDVAVSFTEHLLMTETQVPGTGHYAFSSSHHERTPVPPSSTSTSHKFRSKPISSGVYPHERRLSSGPRLR